MINDFGYDEANSIEEFFIKLINLQKEDKPSLICIDAARKIVKMIQDKPKSLAIFEKTIIIDYDHCVVEVENGVGEFLFLGKKK